MRDASSAQITNNAEISNIKQIMGLQYGKARPNPQSVFRPRHSQLSGQDPPMQTRLGILSRTDFTRRCCSVELPVKRWPCSIYIPQSVRITIKSKYAAR